jgi:hypothetical protein
MRSGIHITHDGCEIRQHRVILTCMWVDEDRQCGQTYNELRATFALTF